jgi:hypothetical protein
VSLLCWMSGTGTAILQGRKVQEGLEGILLYLIRGNLSNCERGMRVFCCTQQGETYGRSKTYDLGLTFVKTCSDLLPSHHGSVIVLDRHGNMEVF